MNTVQNSRRQANEKTPSDWSVVCLGDLISLGELGGNYPNQENPSNYPLIKMGNLGRGVMNLNRVEFISEEARPSLKHRLQFGDLLLNTRNTPELVGKVAIWLDELPLAFFNSNLMRLHLNQDLSKSTFFVNYLLNSDPVIRALQGIATGTTSVAAIYTRDLWKLEVLLPGMDEQIAIGQALMDFDLLLLELDQLIVKKRDIKQGVMQLLWSESHFWNQIEVKRVLLEHFSGPSPTCEERNIRGNEWGVLRTTCATWEYGWNWKSHKVLPKSYWGQETRMVHKGDTIITKAGPRHRVGVPAFVDFIPNHIVPSGKMLALRPNPSLIEPFFLSLALREPSSQDYLNERTTGMAESQVNFENRALLTTVIKVPSPSEQIRIATISQDMDAEIDALVARREKTALIKTGMMQELLTGRTRLL